MRQTLLFLFMSIPFASGGRAATADRPNILWLIAEDFGPELGCYGTPQVWSPNLDRLAAQGVRYTRAYTTAPVCSASRSAFMTGMYQTTIGAHNHRSHRDDGYHLPPGVRVISDRMRDAGYFTANLRELPRSFGFSGTGKTDWNFTHDGQPFDSDRWADLKTHRPFFAQINFQETHRGFHAPRKADPARVAIPPYYPDHPVTRAGLGSIPGRGQRARPQGRPDLATATGGWTGRDDDRRVHGRPRPGPRAGKAILL